MYELSSASDKIGEEKKKVIIPFKVNFVNKILNGKSSVRIGLPQNTPHTVTEKFYKKENYYIDPKVVEQTCKKLITKGPEEKYYEPITENQRYGWYHNIRLTDLDRSDPRLYFGKRMDHYIKLQLQTMDKKPEFVKKVDVKTEKK